MRSSRRKAANSLAPRSPPFAFHRVFPLVTGVPTGEDHPETCPPRACVPTWNMFRLAVGSRAGYVGGEIRYGASPRVHRDRSREIQSGDSRRIPATFPRLVHEMSIHRCLVGTARP